MHEGLNHQDVVGLEQEYADKFTQFSEQETKKAKVDSLSPLNVASNCITLVNEVPSNSSNNAVYGADEVPTSRPTNNAVPVVNEVLAVAENNEEDRFEGMYPSALDHFIPKLIQAYPHYKVFRKGTKYEYRTVQYELFGPEFIDAPFTDAIRTRDGMHDYPV